MAEEKIHTDMIDQIETTEMPVVSDQIETTEMPTDIVDQIETTEMPAVPNDDTKTLGASLVDQDPIQSKKTSRIHSAKRPMTAEAKKRSTRRRAISVCLLLVLLCLVGSGAVFGLGEYQQYQKDLAEAQSGVQHLRKAEALLVTLQKNPLDSKSIELAQQEFSAALSQFQQVGANLKALPGMTTSVPVYGAKLAAALHVLPLAVEVSQMGVVACKTLNILIPALRNPMGTTGPKLTKSDLVTTSQNLQQIQATLKLMSDQVNQLQPADLLLDPSLGKFIGTFRKDIPKLQDALNLVQQILPLAPAIFGVDTPANYLLEIMDSTELRPGGGFIGNYGFLTLAGGHVADIHMTDIDLIDKPFEMAGGKIAYPAAYSWFTPLAPGSWSFRDSNLDADFPTAARNGEQTYTQEAGKDALPLQGVIAITPWFMEGLLNITGPIGMQPEYNETITAQNLIERIHYHQLGNNHGSDLIPSSDGHSSLRKRFTSYLAEHLMARVRQLVASPSAFSSFSTLATHSFHAKDLQIYLNSSTAESLLQHYRYDSAIQAPSTGDSFFLVDANISPNKANDFMQYNEQDQVTIDTAGNAVHHTILHYAWVIPGQNYGSSVYRDYVHIYVPPGSILQAQNGWEPGGASQAFGREVWAGFFTLTFGQTQTITLTWTVPKASYLDAHGWHYQYMLQKQAGDQWSVNVQVTLPTCARNSHTSGGLVVQTAQAVSFSGSLNEDKNFGVDYTCG